ncbi:MAG: carboxypeptidase-like regulatory domain-containing protein, partial [Bacteroidota bacterium]
MKTHLLLLFFALATITIFGQNILKGKVVDATTKAGIPYVNIGIINLAKGTVSDADGNFEMPSNKETNQITFSAIGYESQTISAATLARQSEVTLSKKAYEFAAVEISAKQFNGEEKQFGVRNKTRGMAVAFGSAQLGTELATPIPIDRPTYIKSANFVLNHAKGDSLLFRIKIYAFEKNEIGANLLTENILIQRKQQKGVLTVDLEPY